MFDFVIVLLSRS